MSSFTDTTMVIDPIALEYIEARYNECRGKYSYPLRSAGYTEKSMNDKKYYVYEQAIHILLAYFNSRKCEVEAQYIQGLAHHWCVAYFEKSNSYSTNYGNMKAAELLKEYPELLNTHIKGHQRLVRASPRPSHLVWLDRVGMEPFPPYMGPNFLYGNEPNTILDEIETDPEDVILNYVGDARSDDPFSSERDAEYDHRVTLADLRIEHRWLLQRLPEVMAQIGKANFDDYEKSADLLAFIDPDSCAAESEADASAELVPYPEETCPLGKGWKITPTGLCVSDHPMPPGSMPTPQIVAEQIELIGCHFITQWREPHTGNPLSDHPYHRESWPATQVVTESVEPHVSISDHPMPRGTTPRPQIVTELVDPHSSNFPTGWRVTSTGIPISDHPMPRGTTPKPQTCTEACVEAQALDGPAPWMPRPERSTTLAIEQMEQRARDMEDEEQYLVQAQQPEFEGSDAAVKPADSASQRCGVLSTGSIVLNDGCTIAELKHAMSELPLPPLTIPQIAAQIRLEESLRRLKQAQRKCEELLGHEQKVPFKTVDSHLLYAPCDGEHLLLNQMAFINSRKATPAESESTWVEDISFEDEEAEESALVTPAEGEWNWVDEKRPRMAGFAKPKKERWDWHGAW